MAPPNDVNSPPTKDAEDSDMSGVGRGNTEDSSVSGTGGSAGNPERPWERPWSLDEMKKSAHDWSLAGDAGMLQYLQQFSHKMISQTHDIQEQVNALLHEAKLTGVRVNNTFNDFIMLANTQFVENRVYDEDLSQAETNQQDKKEEKEKTREEREAELIPKITEAMLLGLNVLDTAFEKLDVGEANSDSEEDDDSPYKTDPILEPKDPYLVRSLPYLIGSVAFMQDDDVGLVDIPSDAEEEDRGTISETESESSSDESEEDDKGRRKSYESESESEYTYSEESTSEEERPKSKHKASKTGSDLFGKGSDEEEQIEDSSGDDEKPQKSHKPKNFADELASKIGKVPTEEKGSDEEEAQPKEKSKKKKVPTATLR